MGKQPEILLNNKERLMLSLLDLNHKFVQIMTIHKKSGKIDKKIIGKMKLKVPELNVADYHVAINEKKKRITVLIFDIINSDILVYHSNID